MFVFSVASFVLSVVVWDSTEENSASLVLIAIGVSILLGWSFLPLHWRRLYSRSPYFEDEFRGTITDTSVSIETATGHAEVPWAKFVRVVVTDDMVLLYRSPVLFNVLAAEFFTSAQDWMKVKSIALESVKTS